MQIHLVSKMFNCLSERRQHQVLLVQWPKCNYTEVRKVFSDSESAIVLRCSWLYPFLRPPCPGIAPPAQVQETTRIPPGVKVNRDESLSEHVGALILGPPLQSFVFDWRSGAHLLDKLAAWRTRRIGVSFISVDRV